MNGPQKLIAVAGGVLVILVGVVLVPWRVAGQAWTPGGGEPRQFEVEGRRHAPIFSPPDIDPREFGLGIPDERFQIQLRAEVDWKPWILRILATAVATLAAIRLTATRQRS